MPSPVHKASQQCCLHSAVTRHSRAAARSSSVACSARALSAQLESKRGRRQRRRLLISCKAERVQHGKGAAVLEAEIPNSREEAVSRSAPLLALRLEGALFQLLTCLLPQVAQAAEALAAQLAPAASSKKAKACSTALPAEGAL